MSNLLKKFFNKTFWKFILVGVINTCFGTGIMFLFYNVFHLNYWISSASNYIFGSILSYILNKVFTFQSKTSTKKNIIKFAANITVCYLIAYGLAKPFVRWVLSDFSDIVQNNGAMLVGMGLFVILNYLGQRFFVFNKNQENHTESSS